jgi:CDP-diacylglycerol--serine O-phosphatidyltransferase
MKVVHQLPNLLTLSNLLMGTIAILATFNHSFMLVVYLTGGCLVADILDGALARKLGVDGPLGVQLDSLADVVSFGVLPALIVYHLPTNFTGSEFEKLAHLILSSLIAVSAGLRLGRFNVDNRPREFFWGLATPAGAIMVLALGWSVFIKNDFVENPELLKYISWLLPVFLIISYQVALKLPGLKSPKPGLWTMIVIAVLTIVGLLVIGPIAIALGIFVYVLLGVVNLLVKWY